MFVHKELKLKLNVLSIPTLKLQQIKKKEEIISESRNSLNSANEQWE